MNVLPSSLMIGDDDTNRGMALPVRSGNMPNISRCRTEDIGGAGSSPGDEQVPSLARTVSSNKASTALDTDLSNFLDMIRDHVLHSAASPTHDLHASTRQWGQSATLPRSIGPFKPFRGAEENAPAIALIPAVAAEVVHINAERPIRPRRRASRRPSIPSPVDAVTGPVATTAGRVEHQLLEQVPADATTAAPAPVSAVEEVQVAQVDAFVQASEVADDATQTTPMMTVNEIASAFDAGSLELVVDFMNLYSIERQGRVRDINDDDGDESSIASSDESDTTEVVEVEVEDEVVEGDAAHVVEVDLEADGGLLQTAPERETSSMVTIQSELYGPIDSVGEPRLEEAAAHEVHHATALPHMTGSASIEQYQIIKHGRWGRPHLRLLTVDTIIGVIDWETHHIMISDVKQIRLGRQTAVLARRHAKGDEGCFASIITSTRSVDIEVSTRAERNFIVDHLRKSIIMGMAGDNGAANTSHLHWRKRSSIVPSGYNAAKPNIARRLAASLGRAGRRLTMSCRRSRRA